jgi:hypothetical protein
MKWNVRKEPRRKKRAAVSKKGVDIVTSHNASLNSITIVIMFTVALNAIN